MTTKAELAVLEKLYGAEIDAALSGQPLRGIVRSKAKIMQRLKDQGLVREVEHTHRDRFGTLTIKGWELTLLGNATYCFSCGDESHSKP